MRFRGLLAALAAGLSVSAAAQAAPLEAYGRLPSIEDVTLSPDGLKMAVIWTNGEERRVVIRDLVDGGTGVISVGPAKIRALQWAGSDHLLISKSTTASIAFVIAPRQEYVLTFDYNLKAGTLRPLMKDVDHSLNVVLGLPIVREVDGKPMVLLEGVYFPGSRGQHAVFQANLETDKTKLLHEGFPNTSDWLIGPNGEPLAETEFDDLRGRWKLKVRQGAAWREVRVLEAYYDRPRLVGFGRDGKSILLAENQGDNLLLREIDPANPTWTEPFRSKGESEPIHDRTRHNLIGFVGVRGDEEVYEFLDPADAAAWGKIQRAYKGSRVSLESWSDDRNRAVVKVDSPTAGPSYAFIDFKRRRADPIGALYEKLEPADISPVRPVRFKAGDGLELSGYLTLPRGREAKGLPLVVLAHGGPASRDDPGFDWWAQALASRGYGVLQVNFRGSDGFGAAFLQAGFGQWGRKMQTDLSDGVADLARQGIIDPKRVCIVGASYGGYAALAGAAFDPGVYRCAASVAGPADLRRFVIWSKLNRGASAQRYWNRFMGAEDPKDPVLLTISPALNVGKIAVPILLVHGKDDTVVPLEQSQIMAKALQAAGKPVELVVMAGEDHWLSRGATRLQMLTSVVAFLEKHNPPQ